MRGYAVPANYIKRHGVLLFRASRPTTLTLCARLKATRLWSYGAEFSLVVEKASFNVRCSVPGHGIGIGTRRTTSASTHYQSAAAACNAKIQSAGRALFALSRPAPPCL